jgi:hypothetical protein
MRDDSQSFREHLDDIRRERGWLIQQIEESQATIARSQELIQRVDELLCEGGTETAGRSVGGLAVL